MRTLSCFLFALLLPGAGVLVAETRLWTDVSGRTIAAEFLSANGEHVFLRLKDGKETKVPLGRLGNDSLEFIRRWKQSRLDTGVIFEAPLAWEVYRSRSFTAGQAREAGYFPIDSKETHGNLRLEFKRYGPPPKIEAGQKVVLRLATAPRAGSGTGSTVRVMLGGKLAGTASGIKDGKSFDIELPSKTLAGDDNIELEVTGGPDDVLVCTKNSGRGARLLVVKK